MLGFYHLQANGASGYDLVFKDGSRKVGGGHWNSNGYRLTLYNDTGTVYPGGLVPGNTRSIWLNATAG